MIFLPLPHRLVHEGQVAVQTLDDGAFRFVKPDGQTFETPAPSPTDGAALAAAERRFRGKV